MWYSHLSLTICSFCPHMIPLLMTKMIGEFVLEIKGKPFALIAFIWLWESLQLSPPLNHMCGLLLSFRMSVVSKWESVLCSSGVTGEDVRVSAHEKLGEVLYILKAVLQKYPPLHNTEVLTSAAVLITKIKSKKWILSCSRALWSMCCMHVIQWGSQW